MVVPGAREARVDARFSLAPRRCFGGADVTWNESASPSTRVHSAPHAGRVSRKRLRDRSGRHRADLDITVVLGGQAHRPVPVGLEVVVHEPDVVATRRC